MEDEEEGKMMRVYQSRKIRGKQFNWHFEGPESICQSICWLLRCSRKRKPSPSLSLEELFELFYACKLMITMRHTNYKLQVYTVGKDEMIFCRTLAHTNTHTDIY